MEIFFLEFEKFQTKMFPPRSPSLPMEGVGGGGGAAAAEDGVEEAAGPSSYTDQVVNGMTPDQALEAVKSTYWK